MAGITDELNKILAALDKQPDFFQVKKYLGTVKKILDREPKNVFAMYIKAKLVILSTPPKDRLRIKHEIISIVNEMAILAHSAVYYHRKWEILKDLNLQDDEVYREQKNACLEILKIPPTPSSGIYHMIAAKFLGNSVALQPHSSPPVSHSSPPNLSGSHSVTTEGSSGVPRPRADFIAEPRTGSAPLHVNFFDRSTGNPLRWNWDFGDGSISHEANPVHLYPQDGEYTVRLFVANQYGSDEITKPEKIIVITGTSDGPDADGLYRKAIIGMVQDYPEIINLVLSGYEKKDLVIGFICDAFGGETPKEFHSLMTCMDEDIPYVLCENKNDRIQMNAKIETKKVALKNKGYSPEFIDWAVEVWKSALLNERVTHNTTPRIPTTDENEIIF
jgi:PKD repeat protein